jgi:hypothetical protein
LVRIGNESFLARTAELTTPNPARLALRAVLLKMPAVVTSCLNQH